MWTSLAANRCTARAGVIALIFVTFTGCVGYTTGPAGTTRKTIPGFKRSSDRPGSAALPAPEVRPIEPPARS